MHGGVEPWQGLVPVRFGQSRKLVHCKRPVGALDEHDPRLTSFHKARWRWRCPSRRHVFRLARTLTKTHDSPKTTRHIRLGQSHTH